MTSTFHSIETSKRALFVNTVSMQTLGHNVANANTEGYTRQRVNLNEANPIWAMGMTKSQQPGQLGTGVEYTSITRIRDSFLDTQYRRENQMLGSWEVQNSSMNAIQGILNEPSTSGLSAVMDKFWNSLETLNRDPSLLSARVAVAGAASNLVDTLKHIGESLTNLSNDVNSNIDKKVLEANNIVDNIARLNVLIRDNESFGDKANDYRDQRDLLLDKLSTIVDVQYAEDDSGMVNITSAGVNVLAGDTVTALTAANATAATAGQLNGYTQSLQQTDLIRNQLNGLVNTLVTGDIKVTLSNGYVTSSDLVALNDVTVDGMGLVPAGQTIPANSKITSSVDVMVKGFNGLHQMGYSLTTPTSSGIPFFVSNSGTFTIDDIKVNPEILADTNKIAASSQYENVNGVSKAIRGNSDIAIGLASLRDAIFTFPDSLTSMSEGTTDDYFRALTADLGIRASNVKRNYDNEQTLTDNLQIQRQQVSGVSMDEELADMIRFQQAYNAAARNMTTVDEMLDRVINQMGRVGL
ncbi:flagellar hook-associated protein FlgK [Paenibacillus puldeungensis]|uniref:Flagellar hook-associated protein 1 n=1 Tax=Paenibacillus puldeungensis TaxID=696536 RepID=A0ABW3S308_9BACL